MTEDEPEATPRVLPSKDKRDGEMTKEPELTTWGLIWRAAIAGAIGGTVSTILSWHF